MAAGIELGPAIEVHRLDGKRISIPFADRVAEPGRRIAIAMRTTIRRDNREHRTLLEEKRDVLIVLNDLHGMRRERPYPAKRHAASRIVAVLGDVVTVPLFLSPLCERKHRLAFIAGPIGIRK